MDSLPIVPTNRPTIFISAKTGKNIDVLLEEIASRTQTDYAKINLKIAIADYGKLVTLLNKYNAKFTVDFNETDAFISATIRREYVDRFMDYIVI